MAHHCLTGSQVDARTKKVGTVRRTKFMQKPVPTLWGLTLATLASPAMQAGFSYQALERTQHVAVRLAASREYEG